MGGGGREGEREGGMGGGGEDKYAEGRKREMEAAKKEGGDYVWACTVQCCRSYHAGSHDMYTVT